MASASQQQQQQQQADIRSKLGRARVRRISRVSPYGHEAAVSPGMPPAPIRPRSPVPSPRPAEDGADAAADVNSHSLHSNTTTTHVPVSPATPRRERRQAAHPRDIPACDRCRTFKKKCSRTFPTCSLCANAGQKCSFSTPANSSAAETHHLRARINWLTRHVNKSMPAGAPSVECVETGTDLAALSPGHAVSSTIAVSTPHASTVTNVTASTPGPASVGSHVAFQMPAAARSAGLDSTALLYGQTTSMVAGPNAAAAMARDHLPGIAAKPGPPTVERSRADPIGRRFVDAYFRNVNRAYPFVDREKVLQSLERLTGVPGGRRDEGSTLLYLVMAIGCTTLQRAGQIPADTSSKFDIAYADIIQESLALDDLESIQILLLLALYSLFDPKGTSAWLIIGIVARKALLFGLGRRISEDESLSASDVELRRRLLWSIYIFDRMMAASLGLSSALADENMDVPQPSLTVAEFASPEKPYFTSILQTNRHVIQLRQIEDRIVREIHLRKKADVTAVSRADRRAILQDIRAEIESWYSTGCLVSSLEADNLPIHNSVTWQSARYYHLLVLLYYPCQFNAFLPLAGSSELLRFAQKMLQSTSVLLEQHQLPLNKVTLCRTLPVGLVLLHSFVAAVNSGSLFPAREEVAILISILEAFADGWTQAHEAARICRQFMAIIAGMSGDGSFHSTSPLYGTFELGMSKELSKAMLRPVMAGLLAVMRDTLGKSTCYCVPELPDERDHSDTATVSSANAASATSPGFPAPTLSPLGGARSAVFYPGVPSSDDSSMNYDWSSGELGFI